MMLIPILASAALLEVGDPQILEDDGTYYLYGTDKSERVFSVAVSEDLVNWRNHAGAKLGGFVFDASDSFATNRFWAAECHKVGGKFYLFHSAGAQTAVAVGDSPLGPFRMMKREPILKDGHAIDNTLFVDEDGRKYMVFSRFREDREWIEEICIAELADDMMSIRPGTEKTLFGATEPWERKTYNERAKGGTVEGPSLIKIDGVYLLFYSANDCRSKEYCVGYAWAKNPYGPYVKCSEPFLRMAGGSCGTGHGSPFRDRSGKWRYVFHSHRSTTEFGPRGVHHIGLEINVKESEPVISTVGDVISCRDIGERNLRKGVVRPARKNECPSLSGFCRRAEMGEQLTVVFFGGSLTWGANATDPNYMSWRGRICERLRTMYPNTPFRFIDAAIGGTGSELGVFRLERDVLKFKPDLMFHEWSVNDGFARSNNNASCSYEGVIRRVLVEAPGCVPVPLILPDRRTMTTEPVENLRRRAEHLALAARYNLNAVDVLGTLRKVYESGKDETALIWPAEIGDNTHPHDYGYGVYADIIWDAVFEHPSDRVPKLTPDPMFPPKYAYVCRQRLNTLGHLPTGWANGYNAMRAGTFDFLCSRWQDGIVRATNKGGTTPAPLKLRFQGEVLLIYGESTVKSGKCEVWVDGKRIASKDCAAFGKIFVPSAYLNWPIASNLDPDKVHELEIRPVLGEGGEQEINIESVCVAGRNGAWVKKDN